jgi:hypothetical protein
MRFILLIPFLLLFTYVPAQKKITAESSIGEVTVFSSGAQVQRLAEVLVPAGRSEIIFSGLSNQLQQQSVQLKADAGITLLSVQAQKDFFSQRKIEQDERALLDRMGELKEKNENDNALLLVYKNEEQMLIKNQSIGGQSGVKPDDLKLALDLQRQRLTEVYQKQLEIERRLNVQKQEMEKINAQLRETGKKRDSVNYTVTALIESRQARSIKFQLLYTIKDAGWYTVYDIRVAEVGKPLDLLMNAQVYQRSGETWKDVSINLSTGNPSANVTPSLLQPWMLGFYDPSVAWLKNQSVQAGVVSGRVTDETGNPLSGATIMVKGSNRLVTSTDANGFFKLLNVPVAGTILVSYVGYQQKEIQLRPGYYSISLTAASNSLQEVVVVGYGAAARDVSEYAKKQKEEDPQLVTVNTQYQPTTIVYKIAEKYTLETDGKTTTIGIRRLDLPASYEYFSAPKADPSVFLTARVTDWEQYELQAGEANLYFEGTYLGKTYIDLSDASDTLSLALGKDMGVSITRKLVREFSAKKLIGANRTDSRQFEITVRNTKKIPVHIIIQDQLPVATSKDIDIENVKAQDAQIDKETGLAVWTLDLLPGAEKKLQIGYSVRYPKEKKLILE